MRFSEKQIDEIVRLMGTLSAASATGAGIGFERPMQITPLETMHLALTCVTMFACVLYLRRST